MSRKLADLLAVALAGVGIGFLLCFALLSLAGQIKGCR